MTGPRMYARCPESPDEAMQFDGTPECVAALREWGADVTVDDRGRWTLQSGDRIRACWNLDRGQWVLREPDGWFSRITDEGFRRSHVVEDEQ